MAVNIFRVWNSPMPTTAALAGLSTGTAIKSHVQLAPPTNKDIQVVGWGVSFNGNAAGVSVECELIEANVAATVTAHVASGLVAINNPGGFSSLCQLGSTLTGYNASAEGSITAVRVGDAQQVQPTNQFCYDNILGYEFTIRAGFFGRLRITSAASVLALAYIAYAE